MKILFTVAVFFISLLATAQFADTTNVTQACISFSMPDQIFFQVRGDSLDVIIFKQNGGASNGPIKAVSTQRGDTILVKLVDYSTLFYTVLCVSRRHFSVALHHVSDTILIKFDGKLHKIKKSVTSSENTIEEQTNDIISLSASEKVLYLANIKGITGNLSVSNIEGKPLISLDYLPESVSLQNLKSGIYLVTLSDGNTSVKRKIFIE